MTFWQFIDNQFARIERNDVGCGFLAIILGFLSMVCVIAIVAPKH